MNRAEKALVLFVSLDVRRWMPVIRCLAVLGSSSARA